MNTCSTLLNIPLKLKKKDRIKIDSVFFLFCRFFQNENRICGIFAVMDGHTNFSKNRYEITVEVLQVNEQSTFSKQQ